MPIAQDSWRPARRSPLCGALSHPCAELSDLDTSAHGLQYTRCTSFDVYHQPVTSPEVPCVSLLYAPSSPDAAAVMGRVAAATGLALGTDILAMATPNDAADYLFQNIDRQVDAVIVFNLTASPNGPSGAPLLLESQYTLWLNASRIQDYAAAGLDPAWKAVGVSGRIGGLQAAIDAAIIAETFARNAAANGGANAAAAAADGAAIPTLDATVAPFTDYETLALFSEATTSALTLVAGPTFLTLAAVIVGILGLTTVTNEKGRTLTAQMRNIGMYDSAYWLSWSTAYFPLLMGSAIVLPLVSQSTGLAYFNNTAFSVQFMGMLLLLTATMSMAMCCASCTRAQRSVNAAAFCLVAMAVAIPVTLTLLGIFPLAYSPLVPKAVPVLVFGPFPFFHYGKLQYSILSQIYAGPGGGGGGSGNGFESVLQQSLASTRRVLGLSEEDLPWQLGATTAATTTSSINEESPWGFPAGFTAAASAASAAAAASSYAAPWGKPLPNVRTFDWSNLTDTPDSVTVPANGIPTDWTDYPPIFNLYMLAVLTVLYLFGAWYMGQVATGDLGASQPLYFPISPRYWGLAKPPATVEVGDTVAAIQRMSGEEGSVRIHKMSKSYKEQTALKEVSLVIPPGGLIACLGSNGAGKSTLVGILSGLLTPTHGEAFVFGLSVRSDMPALREMIGTCPQKDILWEEELTARQHAELYARFKGVPPEEIEAHVEEKLSAVGLIDVADSAPRSFSGGMKRRLSAALAAVANPRLMFLDEPSTGMDPLSRRRLWHMIQALKKGRILFLTTHDMHEADVLGDTIAVLANGRLRAIGTPLFLKSRFGAGYSLTLHADPKRIPELLALVRAHLPGAEVVGDATGDGSGAEAEAASATMHSSTAPLPGWGGGAAAAFAEGDVLQRRAATGLVTVAVSRQHAPQLPAFLRILAQYSAQAEASESGGGGGGGGAGAASSPASGSASNDTALVKEWGLSNSTLEEVFLRLAAANKEVNAGLDMNSNSAATPQPQQQMQMVPAAPGMPMQMGYGGGYGGWAGGADGRMGGRTTTGFAPMGAGAADPYGNMYASKMSQQAAYGQQYQQYHQQQHAHSKICALCGSAAPVPVTLFTSKAVEVVAPDLICAACAVMEAAEIEAVKKAAVLRAGGAGAGGAGAAATAAVPAAVTAPATLALPSLDPAPPATSAAATSSAGAGSTLVVNPLAAAVAAASRPPVSPQAGLVNAATFPSAVYQQQPQYNSPMVQDAFPNPMVRNTPGSGATKAALPKLPPVSFWQQATAVFLLRVQLQRRSWKTVVCHIIFVILAVILTLLIQPSANPISMVKCGQGYYSNNQSDGLCLQSTWQDWLVGAVDRTNYNPVQANGPVPLSSVSTASDSAGTTVEEVAAAELLRLSTQLDAAGAVGNAGVGRSAGAAAAGGVQVDLPRGYIPLPPAKLLYQPTCRQFDPTTGYCTQAQQQFAILPDLGEVAVVYNYIPTSNNNPGLFVQYTDGPDASDTPFSAYDLFGLGAGYSTNISYLLTFQDMTRAMTTTTTTATAGAAAAAATAAHQQLGRAPDATSALDQLVYAAQRTIADNSAGMNGTCQYYGVYDGTNGRVGWQFGDGASAVQWIDSNLPSLGIALRRSRPLDAAPSLHYDLRLWAASNYYQNYYTPQRGNQYTWTEVFYPVMGSYCNMAGFQFTYYDDPYQGDWYSQAAPMPLHAAVTYMSNTFYATALELQGVNISGLPDGGPYIRTAIVPMPDVTWIPATGIPIGGGYPFVALIWPLFTTFLLPSFIYPISHEKHAKLWALMTMGGLRQAPYLAGHWLFAVLLFLLIGTVYLLAGYLAGVTAFVNADATLFVALLLTWAHAQSSWAILIGSAVRNPRVATVLGYFIAAAVGLSSFLVAAFVNPWPPAATYVPFLSYARASGLILAYGGSTIPLGSELSNALLVTFAEGTAALLLGAYLHAVLPAPEAAGVSLHPLYPLFALGRMCCSRSGSTPAARGQAHTAAVASAAAHSNSSSGSAAPVDVDVAAERLRVLQGAAADDGYAAVASGSSASSGSTGGTAGAAASTSGVAAVEICGLVKEYPAPLPKAATAADRRRMLGSGVGGLVVAEQEGVLAKAARYIATGGLLGTKRAVDDLFLRVDFGETLALLGPNGAGKTTTVAALTGHSTPTAGSLRIAGYDVLTELGAVWRRIGVCPQFDVVWDDLPVSQHLEFFARVKGVPSSRLRGTVRSVAERVELDGDSFGQAARMLSGGMRRRLSLGLALIGDPSVLVVDEPTTGLDPATRREIHRILSATRRADRAMIITTHLLDEVDALGCSRVAIMYGGKLAAVGTPLHMKARYGDGYRVSVSLPSPPLHLLAQAQQLYRGAMPGGATGSAGAAAAAAAASYAAAAARAFTFITTRVSPDARLLSHVGATATFNLPRGVDVAAAFAALEEGKAGGLWNDAGLSQATLEEVFVRVVEGAEAAEAAVQGF